MVCSDWQMGSSPYAYFGARSSCAPPNTLKLSEKVVHFQNDSKTHLSFRGQLPSRLTSTLQLLLSLRSQASAPTRHTSSLGWRGGVGGGYNLYVCVCEPVIMPVLESVE